jgi:TonB family protein
VDGVVVLDALICEHGRVVRTVITKSIPLLDAAAAECIVYWSFKSALSAGRPVATWTEVPIRFTLR